MYGQLPPNSDVWYFRARPDATDHDRGVVDGDTLDLVVDLGLRTRSNARFRLYGVDAAETYGVSHDSEQFRRGTEHKAFTRAWIADAVENSDYPAWPLRVYTLREPGSFNRWLCDVLNDGGNGDSDDGGTSLVRAMHDEFGDEVAYSG